MINKLSKLFFRKHLFQSIKSFSTTNSTSVIQFESDLWKTVHASVNYVPSDQQQYISSLKQQEIEWKSSNMKGIWLKIKVDQVELLKETLNIGYTIHHATKEHVILSKWLLEGQKNSLPGYASHYVGCGGAVINSKNEVLMVNEKYGYNSTAWSFPGGRADPNEDIYQTAEREIEEELGFKVKAVDMLLLRESTRSIFNKPDIYFAFIMRPVDENPVVNIDKNELNSYTWIPLQKIDEFLQKEQVSKYYVQKRIIDKVNELYKSGFDFQNDKLAIKTQYLNYPAPGVGYTLTEMANPPQNKTNNSS